MRFFKKAIKILTASLCAIALTACGADGILAPKSPDLNRLFTMTAKITQGEESCTAELNRLTAGKWKITFSEPYQLQGVSFIYSKDGVFASFEGMNQQVSNDYALSLPSVLIKALETAVQDSNAALQYNESGFTLQSGDCLFSFAQGEAAPNRFEIPKERISAEITEFKFNEDLFSEGQDVVLVN